MPGGPWDSGAPGDGDDSYGEPPPPPGSRGCSSTAGSGEASVGSFSMAVNFGRAANENLDLGGQFSVYAQAPSPLLGTRQHLQYRNWLLNRLLQTEVAPGHCERILGADWESRLDTFSVYGRVTTDDAMAPGVTHRVRILQERREAVVFQFTLGDPVGRPTGEHSAIGQVLVMLDSSGAEATSLPSCYELRFGNGDALRYSASDGKVVSCTTASGRTVTPDDAGLEAVWDDSGLVRQVRSEADGLADVVALAGVPGYEIRFHPLHQISGKEDGLYTVSGTPHAVWRLSAPGDASTVTVTRIDGGSETTSRFEYSHNSEGWMEIGADNRTVTSMSSSWDSSHTTRSVEVVEKTSAGAVASRRASSVRRFPFGERIVSSTLDPGGAGLRTAWEYYSDAHDGGELRPQEVREPPRRRLDGLALRRAWPGGGGRHALEGLGLQLTGQRGEGSAVLILAGGRQGHGRVHGRTPPRRGDQGPRSRHGEDLFRILHRGRTPR